MAKQHSENDGDGLGPVELRPAVCGTIVLAGLELLHSQVAVEVDLPQDLPIVRGRLRQVEQVLLALIFNARDAMMAVPADRRRLLISVDVGDEVVIHVADSGPGVLPPMIERLFEPCFSTKAEGADSGLGLSVCRSLMEEFGGSISACNAGGGAVFSLRFTRLPE